MRGAGGGGMWEPTFAQGYSQKRDRVVDSGGVGGG